MEEIVSIRPFLAVLVSAAAIVPILFAGRRPNLREGVTFAAGAAKLGIIISMAPWVLQGTRVTWTVFEISPQVAMRFRVDALGMLFALVASSLWIATSAFSIGYMRGLKEHSQTRYYAFFAAALSATIGVAFSANLFTLYLFYEILSLATYPLVTHHQDETARSSGRKYLTFILGSSIAFVLPAMLICLSLAGTLEFKPGGFMAGAASGPVLGVLLILFLFGFAKAAIMPFHAWLPAAMVAPTPVSALLHAVAVVKVGVFSILRVMTGVFGIGLLDRMDLGGAICWIAAVTVLASSLVALTQNELKRRLAFSTIGQLSYIVLGAGLLAPKGLLGSLLHLAMHAFGKITLFFCAGAIFVSTGKKYISEMSGIGRRMPLTLFAFFLGALSVTGLPPCGGFISKWYLALGTVEADRIPMLVILLASSLLNAAYFFPIVYRGFFHPPAQSEMGGPVKEAPLFCLVPLLLTALISVALFFYPEPFMHLARLALDQVGMGAAPGFLGE